MEVRELRKDEYDAALVLAWEVFQTFEAPDYAPQGGETFYTAIHDPDYLAGLRIYGGFKDGTLIGILATRGDGSHIALFFVRDVYHRQGIGRQLFHRACQDNPSGQVTVNSSPYALEVYRHLGFCQTAVEQTADGIRYTPMRCVTHCEDCPCKRTRCPRHGDCIACRAHHVGKRIPIFCQRSAKTRA